MKHSYNSRGSLLFSLICTLVLNVLFFKVKAETGSDTSTNKLLYYTGFEYTKGIIYYNESPFFLGLSAKTGRIKYQGEWHDSLQLKYDCYEDLLILIDEEKDREIEMISEKLDEFYVDNHHFIKTKLNQPTEGFYELVFDGRSKLYVKWIKRIERNQQEEMHYISSYQCYLLQENQYKSIKTFKDFLGNFKTDKKTIIQYCKSNHLKFKKDPFTCMKQVLSYIEKDKQ